MLALALTSRCAGEGECQDLQVHDTGEWWGVWRAKQGVVGCVQGTEGQT